MGEAQQLVDEVRDVLKKQNDDAIWTYQDIAEYLQLAPETVRKIAKSDRNFPRACEFAQARFHAGKVKAWATKSNRV